MKKSLGHNIDVARQFTKKIIIGPAHILDFKIFSTDANQAYLQSSEALQRDIYLEAPQKLKLKEAQVLKLLKPLYGLSESRNYWGRSF